MQRKFYVYLFFIFLFFPFSIFSQSLKLPQRYVSNRLIVKVRTSTKTPTARTESTEVLLKNYMGLAQVNHVFSENIKVQKLTPLFAFENYFEVEIFPHEDITQAMQRLQAQEWVEYVEPLTYFQTLSPPFMPNDKFFVEGRQWGLEKAKVPQAWEISKGDTNVVIGIIDDYLWLDHPEFAGQLKYNHRERYGKKGIDDDGNGFVDDSLGYDFAQQNFKISGWHGTAVAGVAAAKVNNQIGIAGVGFNTRIMPIKVKPEILFPRLPEPTSLDVAKAIKYAADNGCRIINISLGSTDWYSKFLQETINYATLVKNSLVIAAAGNERREENIFPASYEHVLSVAASDENDAHIGSRSNFIDILAPGKNIWTTNIPNDLYVLHEGSSYAAPFVAGAAGLIMAKFPNMTALQVAEQLRVTADNVYELQANAPFKEKLGKGRINVWRALQENIAMSVRAHQPLFTNRFGNYAFQNDTVSLSCNFVNYLKPSSNNLKAILSSTSPYVQIIKNTIQIGKLGTLDSISQANFLIYLNPNTPRGEPIKFRIGFEDDNYSDYQYFTLNTTDYYLDISINNFSLSSAANGRIGLVNQENTEGIGIEFLNNQILKEAGLMIGTAPSKVINSIFSNATSKSNDFSPIQPIKLIQKDFHNIKTSAIFDDKGKIGLEIEQIIRGKKNKPHQNYVLIDYNIKNQSEQDLDSLYVGLYADWEMGGGSYNLADWDKEDNFGYIYQENSKTYAGIKAIGGEYQYYPLEKLYNDGQINITDGFSEAEKFITLSNGLKRTQAGYNINSANVAHVVGVKINKFAQNQIKKVTFILLSGNSVEELRQSLKKAESLLNPLSSLSPRPILPQTLCWSDTMYVKPTNTKNLNIYSKDNFKEPLRTVSELKLALADTAKTFYLSNADSVIESDLIAYSFKAHKPKANFTSIDSLNIADSNVIYFRDKSFKAIKWKWDFGDNSPLDTLPAPIHRFAKIGNYKVTLTIIDSLGCLASVTKLIKVVRLVRSPVPTLPLYEIYACRTEKVTLAPQNGQLFKFYTTFPAQRAIHSGKTFTINDLSIKKIFITGIDSAFESLPIEINITRGDLKADFNYSPKADTIVNDQISFIDLSKGSLGVSIWEWDFGDGSPKRYERNPNHRYKAQGTYRVRLKVSDYSNCSDTISKVFRVGRKGQTPIVSDQVVCQGNSTVITPSNGGTFNFYNALPLTTPIYKGKSLLLNNLSENLTLYITNADSIVESDYQRVIITVNTPQADFYAPDEILLYRANNTVIVQDRSINAESWIWDMGDGSPKLFSQNVNYLYKKQGEYTITLTIKNKFGCTASKSKKIKIINRSNPPQIKDIRICENSPVILSPSGGTLFKFYETYPSSLVLHTGNNWDIGKLTSSKTYFVTCIDSLHESEATKVEVKVEQISSDFEAVNSEGKTTLFAGDTIFFKPKITNALFYQWYFGDGASSNQNKPFYIYPNAGVYSVYLFARHDIGCTAEGRQSITIKPKSMIPPNVKVYLYPNPTEGEVKLEVNSAKLTQVYIEIYNLLGQKVGVLEEKMIKDEVYTLNLVGRDKGVYLIKISIDNEQIIKKIVYR
ncbi:MAG: PKD domain-containing protein [Thermoflexibacter sp.]|nr:PKD domain-containing protein [Thermoflexibacter sp.]